MTLHLEDLPRLPDQLIDETLQACPDIIRTPNPSLRIKAIVPELVRQKVSTATEAYHLRHACFVWRRTDGLAIRHERERIIAHAVIDEVIRTCEAAVALWPCETPADLFAKLEYLNDETKGVMQMAVQSVAADLKRGVASSLPEEMAAA